MVLTSGPSRDRVLKNKGNQSNLEFSESWVLNSVLKERFPLTLTLSLMGGEENKMKPLPSLSV
jgi:hypothetical protein